MIHLAEFDSIESCRSSLRKNLSSYYSKSGVLLFVYSVLLSRGVELVRNVQTHHQQQLNPNNNARKQVRSDTDEPGECAMTAKHGHCTQGTLEFDASWYG